MSWLGDLFNQSQDFYGEAFPPIISTIEDWGWSILPSVYGTTRSSSGGQQVIVPQRPGPTVIAPIPVGQGSEGTGNPEEATIFHPVFTGPQRSGGAVVPRETVVVEGLPTEVERHPEGDFPAGSIFAPGGAWGQGNGQQGHDLDTPPEEEEEVAHDWGHLIREGIGSFFEPEQQVMQGGFPQQLVGSGVGIGPGQAIPSGRAALPPMVGTGTGSDCGNRRYVTLDRETGKISCKRRRRRRLLTNRDLADLASLKTITGGGAALNAAVIRAVR